MADIKPLAYFRGDFVPFEEATVSIASAPVLYGLSIYTVFPILCDHRSEQVYVFRLEDHFKRLRNSSKIVAFDGFEKQWDYPKFKKIIDDLVVKNKVSENCLMRVGVFVDDILKGTRMYGLEHSLSAFIYSTAPLLPKTGAHLTVSSWQRTPDNSIPSRAKINGSYVNAALMKHEAVLSGFDDALALDAQGHVTEATVANFFMVRGGNLITPDGSADLLEGITRDTVFKLAKQLDIKVEQRSIDRSEIYLAEEAFLSGSSVQLTPVTKIDHRTIGNGQVGPVTQKIVAAYDGILTNSMAGKWLSPMA